MEFDSVKEKKSCNIKLFIGNLTSCPCHFPQVVDNNTVVYCRYTAASEKTGILCYAVKSLNFNWIK